MEWRDNLPDVSGWRPRADRSDTLSSGLLVTCKAIQRRILCETTIERDFNIDNYDSGPGVEDLVRRELAKLLPTRYSVHAGVVNDRDGRTAGDYDVVVRDSMWSPVTKLGATQDSRRYHYPIESLYSAIEVKQTLGVKQLDEAMEKLVKLTRLNRPHNPYGHITENQHLTYLDREGYILNPLRTTVLATRLPEGVVFDYLAWRFNAINSQLGRNEMLSDVYVLDEGAAGYFIADSDGSYVDATFVWNRDKDLVLSISDQKPDSTFYIFFMYLLGHLTRSVLSAHDLATAYGSATLPRRHYPADAGAAFNNHG